MRIHPPTTRRSRLTLLYGLAGAALIGMGLIFYAMAKEKEKATIRFDYTKPIPSDPELRSRLTPEQYRLTRQNGTEGAFHNKYWDNLRPGIYVDIISGEPLFSSLDKFDGHTGRPSFTKSIANGHIVEKPDLSQGTERTEVRARQSDSHLGHLFHDGPPPTGLRYTVNSGALRFIPQEKLEDEGYGGYLSLFANSPGDSPRPGGK
jgi:peptide-methionine (R)-S-oxide reductase